MSPAAEISLIVLRELRRSVRSVKGIVLGVLTLVGALVVAYVSVAIEGGRREISATPAEFLEMKRTILEKTTGDATLAAHLAPSPNSLFVFFNATVWLAPLLVALLTFDAVSGELQHRSIRFWAVRTRRASYFTGKLLGVWALLGLMTLVLNAIAAIFALARGYVTVGDLVTWGLGFWLVAILIGGAWAAIATFVSSCFRTPILALLTTFATFFVLWLFEVIGLVARARLRVEGGGTGGGTLSAWEYVYPNAYWELLLSPDTAKVLTAVGVLLGIVVVMTTAGSLLFARRDV